MLSKQFSPYLKEFVYGGIDGSVTTFAIVAGATGAGLSPGVIIVLGFANLIADGFSMSVGNYLSTESAYRSEHIEQDDPGFRSPYRTALATFCSFVLMGLAPLVVYVLSYLDLLTEVDLFATSCTLTMLAFLFIGFLRSHVTDTSKLKSMAETFLLGGIAALLAYFVGTTLENMLLR